MVLPVGLKKRVHRQTRPHPHLSYLTQNIPKLSPCHTVGQSTYPNLSKNPIPWMVRTHA